MVDDCVRLVHEGTIRVLRLVNINSAGRLAFSDHNEANVDKRTRQKEFAYVFKTAGSLQQSQGRKVTISPIGEVNDPGIKG